MAQKGRLTRFVANIPQGDEGHVHVWEKLSDHCDLLQHALQS